MTVRSGDFGLMRVNERLVSRRINTLGVLLHRGSSCCNTLSRNLGGNAFGVSTETVTPSKFPASSCNPAIVSKLAD
jgi:hypothetical protein